MAIADLVSTLAKHEVEFIIVGGIIADVCKGAEQALRYSRSSMDSSSVLR